MDKMFTILLAEADEETRVSLQAALERTGRFNVIDSTGDGTQAL